MMTKIYRALDPVIDAELDRAQFKNGKTFSSPHEAYAVLQEELEECSEEIVNAWEVIGEVWMAVREDRPIPGDSLWGLQRIAKHIAAEAVQVAAMSEKFLISKEIAWKDDEDEE